MAILHSRVQVIQNRHETKVTATALQKNRALVSLVFLLDMQFGFMDVFFMACGPPCSNVQRKTNFLGGTTTLYSDFEA